MTRGNFPHLALAIAAAAVLAAPGAARAGGLEFDGLRIGGRGVGTAGATVNARLSGRVPDPSAFDASSAVAVQAGEFLQTLPGGSLRRKGASFSWRAPADGTGLRSFTVSPATGRFTIDLRGIEPGDLGAPLPVTVRIGAAALSVRLPLAVRGNALSWSRGDPMEATLRGRLLSVEMQDKRPLVHPLADATFVRNDQEEQLGVAGKPVTDRDGNFSLEVSFTDPGALGRVDLGKVLGARDGVTRLAAVSPGAGSDGDWTTVAVVQGTSGRSDSLAPGEAAEIAVPSGGGLRGGTLSFPAGAVGAAVPGLEFTPLTVPASLPAASPDGFILVAGAEIRAGAAPSLPAGAKGAWAADVAFDPSAAPTLRLERPEWTEASLLAGADLRLFQFLDGAWVRMEGRGKYDPATDTIGPDPADPAGLSRAAPSAWAVAAPAGLRRSIGGTVTDATGGPVAGAAVLSAAGAAATDAEGRYEVPAVAIRDEGLELVQAVEGSASEARVVENGDGGAVDVPMAEEAPHSWRVGLIRGIVWRPDGRGAVVGATVRLGLSAAVRGMDHDDGGTPGIFADDRFEMPDLSAVGVASCEWHLVLPGDPVEFTSSLFRGRRLPPVDLLIEAEAAGRAIRPGGYTIRASYTVPGFGSYSVQAGFRAAFDGMRIEVSDIRMPPRYEGVPTVSVDTDDSGRFAVFFRAPDGAPLEAWAEKEGVGRTPVVLFRHASAVDQDLTVSGWTRRDWAAGDPLFSGVRTAAVLGGQVFVSDGSVFARFDPAGGRWTLRAPVPTPRQWARAAAVGGRIYLIGGYAPQGPPVLSDAVEAYDPATDTWTSCARMPLPGVVNPPAVLGSRVFVFGVGDNLLMPPNTVIEYDADADRWIRHPPCPFWTQYVSAQECAGVVYLVQHAYPPTGSTTARILSFDPATDHYTVVTDVPHPSYGFALTAHGGRLYLIGGSPAGGYDFTPGVDVYDPLRNRWEEGLPMAVADYIGTAVSAGGRVVYCGWFGPLIQVLTP